MRRFIEPQFWEVKITIRVLLPVLFFLAGSGMTAKTRDPGYKYFTNYSYLDYDHHPQNWCIVQDKNGIIYVGNSAGVLVFDGVTWQVVEVPNMAVMSMTIGKDDRIYIGGNDEIGYLKPDTEGVLKYTSLLKYLDENHKKFSYVWSTVAAREGVYFRASGLLLRWNYEKIDMYKKDAFLSLFSCNGKLWSQNEKAGIGVLDEKDNSLPALPGSEVLKRKKIWMLTPHDNDTESRGILIGTRTKGLLIYDGRSLTPFITGIDDYLKKSKISHGIRLTTGDYALATLYGGLLILDAGGHLKYCFDKNNGLQDNHINYIYEDNIGNLWLALSKGLSRLEYRSPFLHYDAQSGLDGMVLTVTKHKNEVYAGTLQGVYVLSKDAGKFIKATGISSCWQLLSTGQSLLAATGNGIYRINTVDGIPQRLFGIQTLRLVSSNLFPGHTWCASKEGLVVLNIKDNQWQAAVRFDEIQENIINVAEDPGGYLWLVNFEGDILKVDFPNGIANPKVTRYHRKDRLHEGEIYMAVVEEYTAFASRSGMFRYDAEKDTFIPDPVLGKEFAYGPDAKPVFRIAQDKNRDIWFHSKSRNYRAIPGPGGTFAVKEGPFSRIPIIQMNAIFPETDANSIWFAGTEGLIRYGPAIKIKLDREFQALVRNVSVNKTTLIFGGYKGGNKEPAADHILPYKDRNISFRCAAPFLERESEIEYSYRLDGYNTGWSKWTSETQEQYTNLDAGQYTFRVRAKNIYGIISREDRFRFNVLPPWYQTWWAYTLYGLSFLLLLYLTVKWRLNKLVREKERLEQIVTDRTREVRDKNEQLQRQTVQLKEQSEKLKEMDKVKSRFFTNISHEFRTPLTLVMSPLEQLLSQSRDNVKKKTYRIMLRNLHLLLTLINQLLELSRIESGKIKLSAAYRDIIPLLKGVVASFRIPAEQKQLTLKLRCPDDAIFLYFDNDKVEEVLYNLLGNAIKFTPAGGRVTLSAAVEPEPVFPEDPSSLPDHVRISIKDTGPGIPKNQICNIFERFFQADHNNMEIGKGTGIGLTLAKEIISLHHGQIDVHSVEGEGTEFILRLPTDYNQRDHEEILPEAAGTAGRSRQKKIEIMYVKAEDELDEAPEGNGEDGPGVESGEEGKTGEPEKTMILVVEDHADMRRHIRESLTPEYRVIEAADGKEGIAKAIEFIPDLVISDIMMPGADGFELCRRLKKDIRTSHIPVIMLTARAGTESVIRGLGTGADDYVTKPFNTKILVVRIENLIELRRQMQLKIQRQKMLLPAEVSVSSQDDLFLQEFQKIIEENLDNEELDVDYLCDKLIIGRATLFRKIQALTGESPNQFIQSYRLERGAQLLRENYGNVTEVAFAVGFSSSQYFAACFKEKFHQSPKAYRASEAKIS